MRRHIWIVLLMALLVLLGIVIAKYPGNPCEMFHDCKPAPTGSHR